jgi:DNA-binding NarL/FixJ family response regulator
LVLAHGDDLASPTPVCTASTDSAHPQFALEMLFSPEGQALLANPATRRLFYPGVPHSTHSELEKDAPAEIREMLRFSRQGAADTFGLFAYPLPGIAVVMWCHLDATPDYARGERLLLDRIAAHVDSAFRLRASPLSAVAAVLAPDGKLLDLERPGLAQEVEPLGPAVAGIERLRLGSRRTPSDSLEDWRALLDGKYSVIPREDRDGKRYYLLVFNGPPLREHARLSETEIDVLTFAARGFNGKSTAYALGLSEAAVSIGMRRAAKKLGLRSRAELVGVAAALFGKTAEATPAALSPAEREVFDLLRRGLTNQQIAELRARSPNTVANQIASILRKTNSPSRRNLWS